MTIAKRQWFRGTNGVFTPVNATGGLPYALRPAHDEVILVTNSSFNGDISISAIPTTAVPESAAIGIWVDGVFNQTVSFNGTLSAEQTIVVHTAAPGAHTIRIQEGDRFPGVFITKIVADGQVQPVPSISRQYTTMGDSVSMGVFSNPRSSGWAQLMKGGGSRFDSVTNIGQSGLSLSNLVNSGSLPATVQQLLPAAANYTGSIENVVSMCLGLNDYITSAASTTAATFQTSLGQFCDLLIAAAAAQGTPGFKIWLHSLTHIVGGLPGAANDKGSTPADFLAAAQAVATARPATCTYLNVFNACTDADMSDVDHPNAVGHGKIYAVVNAAL